MGTHLRLSFRLILHEREKIKLLIQAIANHSPSHPVYIVQMEDCMQINFDHEWDITEIEREFAGNFPDYEYIEDISNGNEEVLLGIDRMQNPTSSNSWGQTWNEDTLISYRYLVKKKKREPMKPPHPKFWVLFGEEIKEYRIHISPGYIEGTNRKGFFVIKPSSDSSKKSEIVSGLMQDESMAFWEGYRMMESSIEAEYEVYLRKQLTISRRKNKRKI